MKDQPNRKIVELLSQIGLEEQLFVYLPRFRGPPCGGLPRAFECFKVSSRVRRKRGGDWSHFCPVHELNHFRLAQKLRDECGFSRSNSPSNCSQCFENIVELEGRIFGGDGVSLVVEACDLKSIAWVHMGGMFECASTLEQLMTVFDGVSRSCGEPFQRTANFYFEQRFDALRGRGMQP